MVRRSDLIRHIESLADDQWNALTSYHLTGNDEFKNGALTAEQYLWEQYYNRMEFTEFKAIINEYYQPARENYYIVDKVKNQIKERIKHN